MRLVVSAVLAVLLVGVTNGGSEAPLFLNFPYEKRGMASPQRSGRDAVRPVRSLVPTAGRWRSATRVSVRPACHFFSELSMSPSDKLPMPGKCGYQTTWNRCETPGANAADYKGGEAIVKQGASAGAVSWKSG